MGGVVGDQKARTEIGKGLDSLKKYFERFRAVRFAFLP